MDTISTYASNASNIHLVFDDGPKTPCGMRYDLAADDSHPAFEIKQKMSLEDGKKWIKAWRWEIDDGYRICKRCLKAYDKIIKEGEKTATKD